MFFFWVVWACCSDPGRPNSPVILTSSVPVSISLEVHPVCSPRDGRRQTGCHRNEGLLGRPASQRSTPPAPQLFNDARPAVVMGGSWVDSRGTGGVPLSRVQGSLCLGAALMDGLSMRLPVVKAPGPQCLDAALMDGFSMRLSSEGCVTLSRDRGGVFVSPRRSTAVR